ncbi:TPA: hypothetical protein DEP58_01555 [Patescibacteria group bacterium]|nr:hypothetical protein [Patescibacteria group bacterium]
MYCILPNPRYDNKRVISWSDIVAIENGTYPKSIPPSRKMLFGTYIHNLIEQNKLPICVPKGVHHEFKVQYKRFVGTIDSCDDDTIIDYKTATKHWSRIKAESHEQLVYYGYLRFKNTGILPKRYKIVSLETGLNEDDELVIIGEPRIHIKEITLTDLLRVKARADKALLQLKNASSDDAIKATVIK